LACLLVREHETEVVLPSLGKERCHRGRREVLEFVDV
jgi:hypothetical protein